MVVVVDVNMAKLEKKSPFDLETNHISFWGYRGLNLPSLTPQKCCWQASVVNKSDKCPQNKL